MEQEKIIRKTRSYSINVAGGKVDSLRLQEDLKTVIRAYEDGKVGIAGRIGEGDDGALLTEAQKKLAQNISYPCVLSEGVVREEDASTPIIPEKEFVRTVKRLIDRLNARFPDFIFSNKINMEELETEYSNGRGTRLKYKGNNLILSLVIKEKTSANIMDLDYSLSQKSYDEEAILSDVGKLLNVYGNKVPFPEEELPVVIETSVVQYALSHIVAELYVSGSSLFNGKLGQKIFDEKVNLLIDRSPENRENIPFFDAEGTINPDDKFYFIKEGVLCGLATYKRSAQSFSLPLSGSAGAEFDSVPSFGFGGIKAETGGVKLSQVVKGKAIYIAVAPGGDMTPDGVIATPVMLAYLYDNGKLVGTLSDFGISASIFDLLGKDLIAVAENDVFSFKKEDVIVAHVKIDR